MGVRCWYRPFLSFYYYRCAEKQSASVLNDGDSFAPPCILLPLLLFLFVVAPILSLSPLRKIHYYFSNYLLPLVCCYILFPFMQNLFSRHTLNTLFPLIFLFHLVAWFCFSRPIRAHSDLLVSPLLFCPARITDGSVACANQVVSYAFLVFARTLVPVARYPFPFPFPGSSFHVHRPPLSFRQRESLCYLSASRLIVVPFFLHFFF